jgi:hypothetical protein
MGCGCPQHGTDTGIFRAPTIQTLEYAHRSLLDRWFDPPDRMELYVRVYRFLAGCFSCLGPCIREGGRLFILQIMWF